MPFLKEQNINGIGDDVGVESTLSIAGSSIEFKLTHK
jgi:hypothetical protein